MAIPYDGEIPGEGSDFASMRDSFYILMNINQYKMKPLISMTKEAEGLLRIMLFSRDLKLIGTNKTLKQMREKMAKELRSNRRRGVVPVFISTLWFLFSLGISIQSAFGYLGSNSQAHDLAMGLFVSWFPILILCSIVDRNPVASDDIQRKLNKLIDVVCDSLRDYEHRENFIASFRASPEAHRMAHWVRKISHQAPHIKGDYFCGFAGQARVRFHYGAAHAILIDIEKAYIAEHGRNWLANEHEARMHLVLGNVDHGFVWFDGRQIWQILSGVVIVIGTGAGAFVLSYFTPTVGLACRTGGYLVFGVTACALLVTELAVWLYTSPIRHGQIKEIVQQQISLSNSSEEMEKGISFPGLAMSKQAIMTTLDWLEKVTALTIESLIKSVSWTKKSKKRRLPRASKTIHNHFRMLRELTARQWFERWFLQPIEVANTIWLCYLILAQTFGAFVTCACQSSIWASGGGYLDFASWDYTSNPDVARYWVIGTSVTCVVMGLGMLYVCVEWCLQAHLSTEDYEAAMRGMRHARIFRRATFRARYPASLAALGINHLMRRLGLRKSAKKKSLVWTTHSHYTPGMARTIMTMGHEMQQLPFIEPARKDDEKGYTTEIGAVETPELAHIIQDGKRKGSVAGKTLLGSENGGSGSVSGPSRTSFESPSDSPWGPKMV